MKNVTRKIFERRFLAIHIEQQRNTRRERDAYSAVFIEKTFFRILIPTIIRSDITLCRFSIYLT